ncbi:hypothetical protein QAD02_006619 [Eretmocerus hayati]|uniref:Uncharacterized protein n=1 Tax=Eretmocerus hayati TaxID=131215 RepID=A0ACC2N1R4_9HYME|nr:hypothetical protein QAD02_006619 [Eretmocerus hayati]
MALASEGETRFYAAIESNDIETVHAYINQNTNLVDINARYKCKGVLTAPILVAIQKGYTDLAKMLIDAGATLDENLGFPPFRRARKISDPKTRWQMIKLLRKYRVNITNGDQYFMTKNLHHAVVKGNFEMVKLILEAGANVNCTKVSNLTPLQSAMLDLKGEVRIEMIRQLIRAGADVNLCCRGSTCLYMAIQEKVYCWKLVELLLNSGACMNYVDKHNRSPLSIAATNNRYDLVKQMIDAGANVNISKWCTNSPLHQAIMHHHTNIVKLLLDNGADVNARDIDGKTILYCAAKNFKKSKATDYIEILKMVLNFGARVDHVSHGQFTAFKFILKYANFEIMKLFFQRGLQLRNCGVQFPLHHAAVNEKEEILDYLLKRQLFDVDELDDHGTTALFEAVCSRRVPCIRLLIKWGADVDISNSDNAYVPEFRGQTPLRQALKMTQSIIVDLLLTAVISVNKNVNQLRDLMGSLELNHYFIGGHFIGNLVLLKSQNYFKSLEDENSLMNAIPHYLKIVDKCFSELEDMKSCILHGSLRLYDFLTEKDVTRYVNNKAVVDAFKSMKIIERFPYYGAQLRESYLLTLARKEVMDQAKPRLSKLLGFHLDGCDEIFYNIMTQLRMKDLRNLCIV